MIIEVKYISELSEKERAQLSKVSLQSGLIKSIIGDYELDNYISQTDEVRLKFYLHKRNDRIVGWVLIDSTDKYSNPPGDFTPNVYVYTHSKCRRHGIAKKLVSKAIGDVPVAFGKIKAHPWDNKSASFFSKFERIKFPSLWWIDYFATNK